MSVAEAESVISCADGQVVQPWQAEPYRLWSLLDMKPFDTAAIALALAGVADIAGRAGMVVIGDFAARRIIDAIARQTREHGINAIITIEEPLASGFAEIIYPQVLNSLVDIEGILRSAPLPSRFANKALLLKESISSQDPKSWDFKAARTRFSDFADDLILELKEPKFLYISPEHRALFEQPEPIFGALVDSKFPDSKRDISAAGRCLALDEWTACVIHLMRALESPLHALADRVGVTFPSPLDLENWKTIVDKVESEVNGKVRQLEQQKKSHERNDELKRYGEAALQFRHFKNAWRNDAAHGRDHYDEREATAAFEAVKAFTQQMAEIT